MSWPVIEGRGTSPLEKREQEGLFPRDGSSVVGLCAEGRGVRGGEGAVWARLALAGVSV